MSSGFVDDPPFDVIVNENASPANNPEASYWTKLSQKHNLRFLDLPEAVLEQLANDATLGVKRVVVKWGFLRGVDRPIATVARSGHAVFARDDLPAQAGYDIAQAIDLHHEALKWYIRPYSFDSRTVSENHGVPLHPGAERYYRETGQLPGANSSPAAMSATGGGGCSVGVERSVPYVRSVAALVVLFGLSRRSRLRGRRPLASGPRACSLRNSENPG